MTTVPAPALQINIVVTIRDGGVLYTYTDPDGHPFILQPTCELLYLKQRTVCLFALDAASSTAGWTIRELQANKTPLIPSANGPYGLSLGTLFENTAGSDYRFFIVYYNTVTKHTLQFDPQEANIPPPLECEDK